MRNLGEAATRARHYSWVWGAIVVVAGMGVGCRKSAGPAMPERPPAQVTVATAIARDVPVYLDEIGRIVPVDSVAVIPQVGGKITAAHLEDGAFVNKGDLLFEIDDRTFKAAVALAEALVAQNRAELELADVEYKRVQDLMNRSIATPLEYDQRRVAKDIAQAKLEWAQAALDQARLDLEHTRITSPVSGRAGARLVDAGNVVKEDDQPLVTIQRLDPIYAEFTVTENDLGTVRKYVASRGGEWGEHPEQALKVEVDIPASSARVIAALGAPGATSQPTSAQVGPRMGQLVFLDNSVQQTTGTVKLRAKLDNADHYFWPGQFVNVRLILTTKTDAVLIPERSRQVGREGAFVYVVSDKGIADMRQIVLGQRHGDLIVADSGLATGDRVIVTGHLSVMPGAPVVVVGGATTQPDDASTHADATAMGRAPDSDTSQGASSP